GNLNTLFGLLEQKAENVADTHAGANDADLDGWFFRKHGCCRRDETSFVLCGAGDKKRRCAEAIHSLLLAREAAWWGRSFGIESDRFGQCYRIEIGRRPASACVVVGNFFSITPCSTDY